MGKVKIRYRDIERRDAIPFVDNAVNPPKSLNRPQKVIPKMATNPKSMVILFSPTRRERYTRISATTQFTVK